MKRLKKMAVIALVVLALAGCTKSSMDNEMQPVVDGEEFDPAKFEEDERSEERRVGKECRL